ncbi:MAG: hypothetical protein FWD74_07495 [Actinomycetia bacterium]|nr:hypothetical protein [Actinomycetes bacterium]
MNIFRRRERPPARALALLGPDEWVLSWADVAEPGGVGASVATDADAGAEAGGGVVLATPRGLWWPFPDGPRRIGWERLDKAVWRDGELTVTEASVVDELLLVDRPPVRVRLSVPRDLPPTVRKRVRANVVRSELCPIAGGAARVVARRVPGRDGLSWWARLEPGTPDTPAARAELAAWIDRLRAGDDGPVG